MEGEECHDQLKICLRNVEGKIFFSVVARRFVPYLKENSLTDTVCLCRK